MFDLETAIAQWRRQMLAAGIPSPAPLAELESHLREEVGQLVAAGVTAGDAFKTAVARVGNPRGVAAEFDKATLPWPRPILLGASVWGGILVLLAAMLWSRWTAGKMNLLLAVHIFVLTAGYGAAFVAGGCGICRVLGQRWRASRMDQVDGLARAIGLFTPVAAGLVVAGFLLGMIWSGQNRGGYWTGDPREMSTLGAAAWLGACTLVLWFGRLNERTVIQLGMAGNLVVALAWFGAGAVSHAQGIFGLWPLNLFLGLNLFTLGLSASARVAEAKTG
jgi:hypothetical protein